LSTRTELERQLSKLESAVRNVETSRSSIDERLDKLKVFVCKSERIVYWNLLEVTNIDKVEGYR